jgi:hypothetical protein
MTSIQHVAIVLSESVDAVIQRQNSIQGVLSSSSELRQPNPPLG